MWDKMSDASLEEYYDDHHFRLRNAPQSSQNSIFRLGWPLIERDSEERGFYRSDEGSYSKLSVFRGNFFRGFFSWYHFAVTV